MSRLRERMVSDGFRTAWATAGCTAISFVVIVLVYSLTDFPPARRGWLGALLAWVGIATLHTLFTWWAFAGRTGEDLRAVLRIGEASYRRAQARHPLLRWLTSPEDATSWATTLAVLALFAVNTLVLTPSLRESTLLVFLGVALVVSSWLNVVINFAVQYARADALEPSFEFAGTGPRSFDDYLYVALAAQATFGATDVTVTTSKMRRVVSVQTLVAFAFNTVIVAMLVSLLVAGT